MQLRRVFELAGMLDHVDFETQARLAEGALRPDAVVRLPGGRSVAVDAKTPLDAYLDAHEAEDDAARVEAGRRHARQVREHARRLGAKGYWEALGDAPEFVVMFLPGETFLSAALEAEPELFEEAARRRVLLATPATLIALVKGVAMGWRQDAMARDAREIAEAARDLFDRLRVFGEHLDGVGRSLGQTLERYNAAIGSFEGRLAPTARRLEALGVAPEGRRAPDLSRIDAAPRRLSPSAAAE